MKILLIALILITLISALNLQQYAELELETPEIMFTQHLSDRMDKHFPEFQKLIFTTPWNKEGSELVIKYAHKFNYVSPCWYDLTFGSDHIIIQNDNLYNQTFVKAVRAANPKIKIMPRIYIASNQQALLHTIGSFESKFKQAINLVIKIIETQHFDGLVFDTPFNTFHAGDQNAGLRNLIVQFVNSIRINLHRDKLLFYNMANPLGLNLSLQRYAILDVDCVLIQNYDNHEYYGMIQAAINWAKTTKINSKTSFMFLLPFFSRRKGQGIDSKQIMRLFENPEERLGSVVNKKLCVFFEYQRRVQSYVPCYVYFKESLDLLKKSKMFKIGFWEGGNGLELYYQFL